MWLSDKAPPFGRTLGRKVPKLEHAANERSGVFRILWRLVECSIGFVTIMGLILTRFVYHSHAAKTFYGLLRVVGDDLPTFVRMGLARRTTSCHSAATRLDVRLALRCYIGGGAIGARLRLDCRSVSCLSAVKICRHSAVGTRPRLSRCPCIDAVVTRFRH